MEQPPSNMPVMEPKPGVAGWFQVWMTAVTKPSEQTFVDLTETPEATSKTAFIWFFIAGTISAIFQAILRAIYSATGTAPQMPIPGLEQYTQNLGSGDAGSIAITLVTSICLSPVAGGVSVLFFALFTAIIQWVAKLFGGTGTFEKLAYAFAAISVPVTLIASVFALFTAIPFVGACFSILSFGLVIYSIMLQVMAAKGVNRLGWGQAIGSVLLPGLVVFIFCCCIAIGLSMLLGPAISEALSGMQFAP
jgi:hypothetical protein